MNKFSYLCYDCNDGCKFVQTCLSLDSAVNLILMLGNNFNTRRYYVIEVYNHKLNRVTKTHFATTSVYHDPFTKIDFHQYCLDDKCEEHSPFELLN